MKAFFGWLRFHLAPLRIYGARWQSGRVTLDTSKGAFSDAPVYGWSRIIDGREPGPSEFLRMSRYADHFKARSPKP